MATNQPKIVSSWRLKWVERWKTKSAIELENLPYTFAAKVVMASSDRSGLFSVAQPSILRKKCHSKRERNREIENYGSKSTRSSLSDPSIRTFGLIKRKMGNKYSHWPTFHQQTFAQWFGESLTWCADGRPEHVEGNKHAVANDTTSRHVIWKVAEQIKRKIVSEQLSYKKFLVNHESVEWTRSIQHQQQALNATACAEEKNKCATRRQILEKKLVHSRSKAMWTVAITMRKLST